MEAVCAHTKIKEITWYVQHDEADNTKSGKFMCIDCNTDFVPVTPEIRRFIWEQRWKDKYGENPVPEETPIRFPNTTITTPAAREYYTINNCNHTPANERCKAVDCTCW